MNDARKITVDLEKPDIGAWRRGNRGVDYVHTIEGRDTGPHLVVNALMHGNELSGAIAVLELLEQPIAIARGRLTLTFANVAAFETFDPAEPNASRFLDEDMNRLWSTEALESADRTIEKERARLLAPIFAEADRLVDLHSMQSFSPALTLCGLRDRGRRFARDLGHPPLVVADAGHAGGTRLIDWGPFADPAGPKTAILVEAGQHWARATADMARTCLLHALRAAGLADAVAIEPRLPVIDAAPQRFVEVTHAVTVESTAFAFDHYFEGMEVIEKAGTRIAMDGERPVTTPYDRCVLIMPSNRLDPGQTAIRVGRFVEPPA
ncbi:MAG: succinylglutamate desuccinylase/aspartoacylase family protein [Geminicoccaceae bacterium]|nr:succinylglutamate desuccinylase/aspartoacylase family protein [Geminicoccaceae bacterium]